MSAALLAGAVLATIGAMRCNRICQFVLRQTGFVGSKFFNHLRCDFVCGRSRFLSAPGTLRTVLLQLVHGLRQFVLRKFAVLVCVVFCHQVCRQLRRTLLLMLSAFPAARSTAGTASARTLRHGAER